MLADHGPEWIQREREMEMLGPKDRPPLSKRHGEENSGSHCKRVRGCGTLPGMEHRTLQWEFWDGTPAPLGAGWRLHKSICGRSRQAVCELWSHQLGWELRLVVDGGDFRRSQVCRSQDEVLHVTEWWKAAMVGRGCA